MIVPYDFQREIHKQALPRLELLGGVYLSMEERTGKSIVAMMLAESLQAKSILVVTKKKAMDGWDNVHNEWCPSNWSSDEKMMMHITTYQSAHKLTRTKKDLVIIDESHSTIAGLPKTKSGLLSSTWQNVKSICRGHKVVFLSATPYAQGAQHLYPQFSLLDESPVTKYSKYKEFYEKYADRDQFGHYQMIRLVGREIINYNAVRHDEIVSLFKSYFIAGTRKDFGFTVEPEDKKHYITLSDKARLAYNIILKKRVLTINPGTIVCDTSMGLMHALAMLEGGTVKIGEEYFNIGDIDEKLSYLEKTFGDSPENVIMYNYIKEGDKLRARFPKSIVLQASTNAEGVDLSAYKNVIIYSQNFSTANYIQRRCRQANKLRTDPIIVHYLLVKKAISDQIYTTVIDKKEKFTVKHFQEFSL